MTLQNDARAKGRRTVPRLALRREEAAESFGMSVDTFERHVAGQVRCVYVSRLRLYPVSELERFLERQAMAPPADSITEGGRRERMKRGAA